MNTTFSTTDRIFVTQSELDELKAKPLSEMSLADLDRPRMPRVRIEW